MASKGFSVSRLIDMLGAARLSDEKRTVQLGILVAVDVTADRELIEAVRACLTPQRLETVVAVRGLADAQGEIPFARDAAVYVVGDYNALAAMLATRRARQGMPCAIVAASALDMPSLGGLEPEVAELVTCICASGAAALERKLARWLLSATDKEVACAASFPFCRPTLAARMKIRVAAENALLGFTGLSSGSDFTVMTANQLQLAFDLAALYGDELSMQTLADVALVLAAATSSRNAARLVDLVLPFGTRLTRSLFAAAGTMAAGRLVEARHDGTLDEVVRALGHKAAAKVLSDDAPVRTVARTALTLAGA